LNDIQIIVSHFKELNREPLKNPYLEICNAQEGIKPTGFNLYDSSFDDNISEKNKAFCELSALYSVWNSNLFKNFVGLAHYRRFFIFDNLNVHSIERNFDTLIKDSEIYLEKLQKLSCDMVVPIPLDFSGWEHNSIYKHFCALHPNLIDVFNKVCDILDYCLGKNNFSLDWFNSNQYLYPYNMFFGRKEIIDRWCSVIFTVLFELENQVDTNFSGYDSRWAGFISERLFSFFVQTQCIEYNTINSTIAFYG
jgi:hypothetical protein